MTDEDALDYALSSVEAAARDQSLFKRNGRLFMALPARRLAALHTLRLYQPQRPMARCFTFMMQFVVLTGLHRLVLPRFRHAGGKECLNPDLESCLPGTAGVMLGSPEHRVRRAIASYQTKHGWEVAKVSFGDEGSRILEREAAVLHELSALATGVPQPLGLHRGGSFTILRMPYLTGRRIAKGEPAAALSLLNQWISGQASTPASEFPEWTSIEAALQTSETGRAALVELSKQQLVPVIRHGDFARWNLRKQADGSLVVLDWEWGHQSGMPGLDLVHYILQDARLVDKLKPADAIATTLRELERPACRKYLHLTGWTVAPLLAVIASLAWKQGAGHQENAEVLEAAVSVFQ